MRKSCACVRACVRACMRVRGYVLCVCVGMWVCVGVYLFSFTEKASPD